jgi:hypothetical protein
LCCLDDAEMRARQRLSMAAGLLIATSISLIDQASLVIF